ncbi:hypothetical protein ACFXKF_36615 [Streptomyces scopuliridis]|uniref:hypothetical protein n=1 Tax=Streptomyces scopuliridis TaxID=452529 RepID=UPI00369F9E25
MREFGAVLYFVDRSGEFPSYLRPDPVHRALGQGWARWAKGGACVEITGSGCAALAEYEIRVEQDRRKPYAVTRNLMRGEPHNPSEAFRVLREVRSGEEIQVGDTVNDPFGVPVIYLGPSMSRSSGESAWRPGLIVRVLYAGDTPWVFLPAELGAAYEDTVRHPAWTSRLGNSRRRDIS